MLGRHGEVPDAIANNGSFTQTADFSFGYQPISGNYPSGSPGIYVVMAGDSLQSIAQSAYGDSKLWYRIADANGLGGDADLRVGQALTIPAGVTNGNDATTFKPYDPTRITGDTTPNLPVPKADKGCGGVGQLIMVVVAVVATIYTAGATAASGALGANAMGTATLAGVTTGGGFGATMAAGAGVLGGSAGIGAGIAAGALGGAAGSIASQAVGNAIGAQDGFNWTGVALGALAGGIGGGLSGTALGGQGWQLTAARMATANALTQGVAVATGLQQSFD